MTLWSQAGKIINFKISKSFKISWESFLSEGFLTRHFGHRYLRSSLKDFVFIKNDPSNLL